MGDALTLPSVSFVVPTYRRPETLRRTLEALLAVDYPSESYEIVVADDGSGDNTAEVVASLLAMGRAKVTYLQHENSGAASARNHGARAAVGELLIFVDDDILVEPSHIHDHLVARGPRGDALVNGHWEFPTELARTLSATPFGQFRLRVETWVKEGIPKSILDDGCESPSTVTACNLSIRRQTFWGLGGFDETFPFAGAEDQEFSYRAVRAGCELVYDRRITLLHDDQRLTLLQFCERQRRGACTAVYLAKLHPGEFASRPLIVENGPLTRTDPPRTMVKKLVKWGLSRSTCLAVVRAGVRCMERAVPDSKVLQRAYWSVCGLYIFLGVRDGFAAVSGTDTSAHAEGAGIPCP
jgi:GT2 family glycosyltransferase